MELLLTEEQKLLQESAGKFVERHAGPARARALRGGDASYDRDTWREIAEAGWLGILAPEKLGGLGLGMTELSLILEQGGRALMMEPLGAGAVAAAAIADGEAAQSPGGLLEDVIGGRRVVLPAIHEQSYAADPDAPATRAEADGKAYRLGGTKSFIPSAAGADGFLVHAKSPRGNLLCYLPTDTQGVDLRIAANVDAGGTGTLVMDNAPVPEDQVIAGANRADEIVTRMNDRMILGLSAELVGVMQQALDITLEYLKVRKQFDRPIGSFQALQHRAVNEFINVEVARSFVFQVAGAVDAGNSDSALAAAVKAKASHAALSVTKSAIQMHGGIGYTDEHDIGLYFKRAAGLAAQYGNQAQQRGRYARLSGISPAAEK